tara:strand:- start:2073 stop:2423 length:351 start_codon:yes stop_codon:yes gene_type:complete
MSIPQDAKLNRLPAKYNHLFIFGYWLLKQQPHSPSIQDTYLSQFYCEGNINDQMKIFNEFWSNRKEIEKHMKNGKKPGRPKKTKKELLFDHEDGLLKQLIEEAHKEIQGGIKSHIK